jgi:hypothetical protein
MTTLRLEQDWKEIDFGGKLQFSLPAGLAETKEQGIDSRVGRWEGEGITVRVDYGIFSDPLTSYAERPNYRLAAEKIDNRTARVVSFDLNDGKDFIAAHFGGFTEEETGERSALTIVVETEPGVGSEVASQIIRSVRFKGETQ